MLYAGFSVRAGEMDDEMNCLLPVVDTLPFNPERRLTSFVMGLATGLPPVEFAVESDCFNTHGGFANP